jgi:maltose O-acetyltransferase
MDPGETVIGNGCWVGAGAIILKGVHLGDRSIVGAGAVVTKSFPAGSIVAGVPARLVKTAAPAPQNSLVPKSYVEPTRA